MTFSARSVAVRLLWLIPLVMVVIDIWTEVGGVFHVLTWIALGIALVAAVIESVGKRRRRRA